MLQLVQPQLVLVMHLLRLHAGTELAGLVSLAALLPSVYPPEAETHR